MDELSVPTVMSPGVRPTNSPHLELDGVQLHAKKFQCGGEAADFVFSDRYVQMLKDLEDDL